MEVLGSCAACLTPADLFPLVKRSSLTRSSYSLFRVWGLGFRVLFSLDPPGTQPDADKRGVEGLRLLAIRA